MILRFRDLVADTIPRHREVLGKQGYVWWGWWHKPAEQVPRRVFADFKAAIQKDGKLVAYLADSGRGRFFQVEIDRIVESETETPIPCPEPGKSPAYYKDAEYKAWYQFSRIEEVNPATVCELAYSELPADEFVADAFSERFDSKQVSSLEELLSRHRTIYFVQPYTEGHGTHRIVLLPSVTPAHFITQPIVTDSDFILFLSDLHFHADKHEHAIGAETPGKSSLHRLISEDIARAYPNRRPAAVVIGGDLTYYGKEAEYDLALDCLQKLRSAFGLEPHHFLVIPGNHDIEWQAPPGAGGAGPVVLSGPEAESNYRKFYLRMFGIPANDYLSQGRRFVLGNFAAVDILGLNSVRLESADFAGYGFVSHQQADDAMARMDWKQADDSKLRLLVMHHHLVPVAALEPIAGSDTRYSLTLDAGQMLFKALEHSVDLVLHGHQHQPFMAGFSRASENQKFSAKRSLSIHGTGSAGVRRDLTGAIGKNAYSILRVGKAGAIEIVVHTLSQQSYRFEAAWTHTVRRNSDGGTALEC